MLRDYILKAVSKQSSGIAERVARLDDVLVQTLECTPGGLIEIGLGCGQNVAYMIERAWNYHRLVLGIDPWETSQEYREQDFRNSFSVYFNGKDDMQCFTLLKEKSQSAVVREAVLKFMPIALAFVDGAMDYVGVMSDLQLMREARAAVICVDDYNCGRWPEVRKAVDGFVRQAPEYECLGGKAHETYILRRPCEHVGS